MLGKDTIIFVGGEENHFAPVIGEINKDVAFLAVYVPFSRVENKLKVKIKRPYGFFLEKVWLPVKKVLHKINAKVKVSDEPFSYDASGKKKTLNMLFRYAPSAIVVSDPEILESMKTGIKRSGMNVKIYVYSDDIGFNYDLVRKDVAHYFVDNIAVRDELRKRGLAAAQIDVNPLPVEGEFYESSDIGEAKQKLGFEPTKRLCLILPEGKFFDIGNVPSDVAFVVRKCDAEIMKAEEQGIKVAETVGEKELMASCDYVATRYAPYSIKRASALHKKVIILSDSTEKNDAADYLVADERTACASTGAELKTVIEMIDAGEICLKGEETDSKSAEKIAYEIKELVKGAKQSQ